MNKMFQESEIKVEKFSNTICFCCLSVDRVLRPLGIYKNVLSKIMGDDKNCMPYSEDSSICWECMSFLKRTVDFHQKVLKASFMFSSMDLSHFGNNSLSRLGLIWIDNTDYSPESEIPLKEEEITVKEEIINKEESNLDNLNDTSTANEYHDDDFFKNDNDFESYDEMPISEINDFIKKKKIKMEKKYDKVKIFSKDTYKKVSVEKMTFKDRYHIISVDLEDLKDIMNKEKMKEEFKCALHKCETCIATFKNSSDKAQHDKQHHSKRNNFLCDVCAQTFPTKQSMVVHTKSHKYIYMCRVCADNRMYHCRKKMYQHFTYYHRMMYMCQICNVIPFGCRAEFVTHFKEFHKKFTCDYCMKTYNKKESLIGHIRRHHSSLTCTICNKTFKSHRHYANHMRTFHPVIDENAYCVECNLVFKSELLYKRHLRTSVKHKVVKKKSFPCPKCNKVYLKRSTMNYHYNYVHEKKTKFICDKCNRMFLNGFRLRQHVASVHDKIPKVKNKICTYCGRGFNTNKILNNHILTHTGERPHKCELCGTTFAQKTALNYHIKNVHCKNNSLR